MKGKKILVEERVKACVGTINPPFSVCFIVPLGFALKIHSVAPYLFILSLAALGNVKSEQWMWLGDLQRFLPASINV